MGGQVEYIPFASICGGVANVGVQLKFSRTHFAIWQIEMKLNWLWAALEIHSLCLLGEVEMEAIESPDCMQVGFELEIRFRISDVGFRISPWRHFGMKMALCASANQKLKAA